MAARRDSPAAAQVLLFGRNFLKHPRMLGSIVPSSRFLVERVLAAVSWGGARTVVEYGPGVGTMTRAMLRRLRPDGRLLLLETNGDFVHHLRHTIHDSRLRVEQRSAEEVNTALAEALIGAPADAIVSGIPYSTMPTAARTAVLRATSRALAPGGTLVVYQFSRAVLPYLEAEFPVVERSFELRNVLPAHVFVCRRNGAAPG